MKVAGLFVLCLALSGCGSINTVVRGDDVTSRELTREKSYCTTVPRVYSGVYYDFCLLNAPAPESEKTRQSGYNMPGLLLDAAVCVVLDTVALPYTVYRQSRDGSIEITRLSWKPES
ncbi:YceK/YidQ family lipoprotein [Pseudomonas sp. DWP3-1-2]|uniref:YceK/YidQ family lipoprotein n=1 Tax=Pseudomonas sp. DWP3-1-2 TaxID=2804645 RepID=UPI003CF6ADDA